MSTRHAWRRALQHITFRDSSSEHYLAPAAKFALQIRPEFFEDVGRHVDSDLHAELPGGIACDDGAAAHFVDDTLAELIADRPDASAYRVVPGVTETRLDTRFLGESA